MVSLPTLDWRSRAKAALIHLLASAVVALLAALLVFGVWYPSPYREVAGGRQLFLLVVAVDVAIGPLITFAVFDLAKGRRHLRRDLIVVAVLQLMALAYGLHSVFLARPVYVVHEVDRFQVVRAAELDDADLAEAPDAFRRLPLFGPETISVRQPTDPREKLMALEKALGGRDLSLQPKYWQTYAAGVATALKQSLPLEALKRKYPQRANEIDALANKLQRPLDQLRFVPLVAHGPAWVAILDGATGEILNYAPFDAF